MFSPRFFCSFSLIFFSSLLLGQNLIITDQFQSTYVGTYTSFYEDKEKKESINSVLTKPLETWKKQNVDVIRQGNSSSTFWCKFSLENKTGIPQGLTIVLEYPQPDYVQFYSFDDQILEDSSLLMGDIFPFSQRIIKHRHFIYNYQLPANSTRTIYCKSGQLGGKFYLPLKVYKTEHWFYKNNDSILTYGLIIGIVLILSAVAFILFIILHKLYALFFTLQNVALLFFFLGFSGLGFQYVWPESCYYQQACTRFPNLFFSLFKLLFLLSFFEFKKVKQLYRMLWGGVFFILIVLLTLTIATMNQPAINAFQMRWLGWISYGSTGGALILSAVASIVFYLKTKDQNMLWYLRLSIFQFLILLLSMTTYFTNFGFGNFKSGHAAIISCVVEGLIVSFIIINHYKQTLLDKKELTLTLANKQNEALNNLLKGQETERKRLSQELHDGLSIQLMQIKLTLGNFIKKTTINQTTTLPKVMNDLDIVQSDLRNLSHALNPFVLQEFGLKKAINDIIFKAEMNAPEIDFQFNFSDSGSLNKVTEKHLYYIIQELLNNVLKYANATSIEINLSTTLDGLLLRFSDNGKGYDYQKIQSSGIGLRNIQSRVDLMDGRMEIKKIEPKGMEHKIYIKI